MQWKNMGNYTYNCHLNLPWKTPTEEITHTRVKVLYFDPSPRLSPCFFSLILPLQFHLGPFLWPFPYSCTLGSKSIFNHSLRSHSLYVTVVLSHLLSDRMSFIISQYANTLGKYHDPSRWYENFEDYLLT